ncbi:VacJ family lipoprotein [Acinetobacter sp. A3.8]|uniref:VacJ family lipoprotein n=1 Tax=Acinetobacter sedimenti TaxID=2919922 RepID=A0A9X1WYM2_9GAMM|nr:VacJ family lipoprotein [Acinetobacter sedimenti]MCJ8146988.1 VacJ family lipoprotein [Acinetobacter sedimenti]
MFTHFFKYLLCSVVCYSPFVFANTTITAEASTQAQAPIVDQTEVKTTHHRSKTIEALKNIHTEQLKVDAKANQPEAIKDPLQPLNRKVHNFNMAIDNAVVRPVAVQYQSKVPDKVRSGFGNFRNNMRDPWNAVNQLLQGNPKQAAKTLGRFTLNTVTSLGLADPAKTQNLTSENENFGTTLGVWGVPSGPYIVLPFLGPSTFRDGAAKVTVDSFARPQSYIFRDDKIFWSFNVAEGVDTRAQFLELDSVVQGDKYAALRDMYLQKKNFEISTRKGEISSEDMFIEDDSFSDDEFTDEEPSTTETSESNETLPDSE